MDGFFQSVRDFFSKLIQKLSSLEWSAIVLAIFIVLCFAAVIFVAVFAIVVKKRKDRFERYVSESADLVHVYRINAVENSVIHFTLNDLENVETIKIEDFYRSYPAKQVARIRGWVNDILDGRQVPQFLETYKEVGPQRTLHRAFLRHVESDPSQSLIRLEAYLLPNVVKGSRHELIDHISVSGQIRQTEVVAAIRENPTQGITIFFKLRPHEASKKRKSRIDVRAFHIRFVALMQQYVRGKTRWFSPGQFEFVMTDFEMMDNAEAVSSALKMISGVTNSLTEHALPGDPLFEIKAVIIPHIDIVSVADSLVTSGRRLLSAAFEDASSFLIYRKSIDSIQDEQSSTLVRSVIKDVIHSNSIGFFFRPIYDIKKNDFYGFLSKSTPDGEKTGFSSIEDLKRYAANANELSSLTSYIGKTTTARFAGNRGREDTRQKLFVPITVDELKIVLYCYKKIKAAKDIDIFFLLSERNILENLKDCPTSSLLDAITAIKGSGYGISYLIGGSKIAMDAALLAQGDAFIVDFTKSTDAKNMDAIIRSQLHALVEKLLKYKKPIVAANLKNWNAIELVVGSGIDYVSCDTIASYKPSCINDISDKDKNRLRQMKGIS